MRVVYNDDEERKQSEIMHSNYLLLRTYKYCVRTMHQVKFCTTFFHNFLSQHSLSIVLHCSVIITPALHSFHLKSHCRRFGSLGLSLNFKSSHLMVRLSDDTTINYSDTRAIFFVCFFHHFPLLPFASFMH